MAILRAQCSQARGSECDVQFSRLWFFPIVSGDDRRLSGHSGPLARCAWRELRPLAGAVKAMSLADQSVSPAGSRLLAPVLVAGTGMMALVFVAMAPVLSTLAQHLGGGKMGAFVAQMVMSTPAMGIVLGAPLWGWLIGRMGAPRVLYTALGLYAIVGCAGLIVDSPYVLIATRFCHGLAVAGVVTSTSTLIGRLYQGQARERLFGIQGAVGAGMALVGVIAAGAIGQVGGWRAPFALYLLAIVMLALAFAALRSISLPSAPREAPVKGATFQVLRGHYPFYLMTLGMSVVMQMTGIQTGLVLAEDNVHDPAVQSVVLGMASVTGILAGIGYGALRSKVSAHTVALLILAFWCLGQSLIGLSEGALETGAAVALSGIGSGLMMVFLPPLLLDRLDRSQHAAGLGLYYSTMFLGDFINPLIMGGLLGFLPDYHAVFLVIGLTCGACFMVTLFARLVRGKNSR
jgi:MFS family permease